MNFCFTIILFLLICLLLNVTCLSRGGGGRGGGSRSGGSRSGGGYRSGSSRSGGGYRSSGSRSSYRSGSGKIGTSSRYNSWSVRVGVTSTTRYRSASWSSQHYAITSGYIIMSSHQQSRFHVYDQSYYSSISVCYNEMGLYGRNLSGSPWFMCPWNNPSERFCCGNELEERCCRYFDRSGPLAGLIVGLILLVFLIAYLLIHYRKSYCDEDRTEVKYTVTCKVEEKSDGSSTPTHSVEVNTTYNNTAPYTLYIPPTFVNQPPYPPTGNDNLPYPTSMNNPNLPYPTGAVNTCPYPLYDDHKEDNKLPYSVDPGNNAQMTTNTQASAPYNPANPNASMPPSYEDALRI